MPAVAGAEARPVRGPATVVRPRIVGRMPASQSLIGAVPVSARASRSPRAVQA